MRNYLITFRSVTYAQKGERVLKRSGIDCFLRRTPKALTSKACGYCLQIRPGDADRTIEILRGMQVEFDKVYAMDYNGSFEELVV